MSEVWSLPGYDVQALLGFGATGEVWRARELATGDTVALKRLRPDADPAAVEALRREATLLATLDTPYVVRLREVVGAGAGAVLVLDHAAGGSLATLLARRGALDPGEVVTIGGPLAQALAAAHARGLVHGDVTPSNVLFTADGMPLLADLGVARLVGEERAGVDGTAEYVDPAVAAGGTPGTAADVWALAAVCHHMLAGSPPHDGSSVDAVLGAARTGERAPLGLLAPTAPRALITAVEAALVPEPDERPTAAGFAALLRRAHAAAPVQLTGGPAAAGALPPARETHAVQSAPVPAEAPRRRRLPVTVLLAAGLVVLVVAGAVGGWMWGRRDSGPVPALPSPKQVAVASPDAAPPASVSALAPPSSSAAPAPPAATPSASTAPSAAPLVPEVRGVGESAGEDASEPVDWVAVLDRLDAARAQAFATGEVAQLDEVYAPASAGLAADAALVRSLADRQQTAAGVRHEVRSVEVLEDRPDLTRLRVVDVLAGYELRDARGVVVARAPPRGPRAFLVELRHTSAGWRLIEVRAAAADSPS